MRQIYGYPVPNIDERLDVRVFKCLNDLEGRWKILCKRGESSRLYLSFMRCAVVWGKYSVRTACQGHTRGQNVGLYVLVGPGTIVTIFDSYLRSLVLAGDSVGQCVGGYVRCLQMRDTLSNCLGTMCLHRFICPGSSVALLAGPGDVGGCGRDEAHIPHPIIQHQNPNMMRKP